MGVACRDHGAAGSAGRARLQDQGVGGDADVEGVGLGPSLPLPLPLLGAAVVGEQLEGRAPLFEFHLPVEHHAGGHHDEVGAPHPPAQHPGRECSQEWVLTGGGRICCC